MSLFFAVFGEKTRVVTVFIASAALDHPWWMTCPNGSVGCGGRDEYGHDGGVSSGCTNMTSTPNE
jgi:hypothetical protein